MNKYIYRIILVFLSSAYSSCLTADAQVQALANQSANRILFIGNSYLYYNDSLHNHVRRMAEEKFPERADLFIYKSSTIGGSRLSHHNLDHLLDSKNIGVKQNFELVILQGGSSESLSEDSRQDFYGQVAEQTKKIRARGGEAALYMTHAYVKPHKAYFPDMINEIEDAYLKVGNDNKVLVIPVGLAFERAYQQKTGIKLHKDFDGSHPSFLGTYLASCVVFASIFKTSPVGLHYSYFDAISDKEKAFLQRVAEETVAEFYGYD